jgi:hypothetical protein
MGYDRMKNFYVILTGSKNNAGDYLIKYRAKQLFHEIRPDREIVDYDAWKPLTLSQLNVVNNSKALILMGGPALQYHMRPNIYGLIEDLDKIKVPVIVMGVGWKSPEGDWSSTHSYPISAESFELLRKVEASGYMSSVRDYHTMNVLFSKGFSRFMMTGCPALYSFSNIGKNADYPDDLKNISFSLGARFAHSPAMYKSTKSIILQLKNYFKKKNFRVVFHHSIENEYLKTDQSDYKFWVAHQDIVAWLDSQGISYVDISGSAENLINHYATECIHIGYRVHAHIFMNSVSKLSVLLNEDGRGKALRDVIGGLSFDSCSAKKLNLLNKILKRMNIKTEMYNVSDMLPTDLVRHVSYELKMGYPRLSMPRYSIDRHFLIMKSFLMQLP